MIELGNNTSPFKRQRLLRDCLSNLPINTLSSLIFKPCENKNSYWNFCMQTENAEELELCLQYCWVGFIHAFSLSVCAALCHMIITKQYSFLQNRLEMK